MCHRVPPKSLAGREEVSLSPHAVIAPDQMCIRDSLFAETIENNIKFGCPDATHEQVVEAAKKACCHDFISALPEGYDTVTVSYTHLDVYKRQTSVSEFIGAMESMHIPEKIVIPLSVISRYLSVMAFYIRYLNCLRDCLIFFCACLA